MHPIKLVVPQPADTHLGLLLFSHFFVMYTSLCYCITHTQPKTSQILVAIGSRHFSKKRSTAAKSIRVNKYNKTKEEEEEKKESSGPRPGRVSELARADART